MSRFLNAASVQFQPTVYWDGRHDWDALRAGVFESTSRALESLRGFGLDLVVLSEAVGIVGQTNATAESVGAPGPFLRRYLDFAREEHAHVVGSCRIREAGCVYNSAVVVGPRGILGCYHKCFPTLEELDEGISPGRGAAVIETPIARIGAAICFDLNFKELREEYARLRPDIIAFPGMFHGGMVQAIWAYECRSHFISATCFEGCGILDPFGRPLALSDEYTRAPTARINLDCVMVHLSSLLKNIPGIRRKYGAEVTIAVPEHVGAGLLYSACAARTARQVAREFELEPLDDYLARCRARCASARPGGHA
jgi:hypothetical protein